MRSYGHGDLDRLIGPAEQARDLTQSPRELGDAANTSGRMLNAQSFREIKAEPTRWLWEGRIPLGTATLLVGREKLGKSTLSLGLAARLSRGDLPGDLEAADALIVSYEDSASRTIKPRLMAAAADLSRVHRVVATRGGIRDLVSLPDDVDGIRKIARDTHARLLVVDPLSASLNGDVDSHRDQDIRRALAALVQLAEELDLALLALAHWNKSPGGDSLSRVLGSRGLTAAVRSVLAFGVAPDTDDGCPDRVLAHAACNVGPEAPSLACRIEGRVVDGDAGDAIATSRLVIVGETDTRADDLLVTRSHDERTDTDLTAEWLADDLADGDWHESGGVKARAKAKGYSEKALRRAREKLGIQDRREGFPARSEWRLPPTTESGATVMPSPQGTTAESARGHDCEFPGLEPNFEDGGSSHAPRQTEGTTGTENGWRPHTEEEYAEAWRRREQRLGGGT